MKKKVGLHLKRVLLVLAMLVVINTVQAQIDSTGNPPPSDVPFDGGASILIATGVAYGIKKVRDERKKRKEQLGNQ